MSRTGRVDSFRRAGRVTIWPSQGRSILSPLNRGGPNLRGIILRCSLCSFVSRHPSRPFLKRSLIWRAKSIDDLRGCDCERFEWLSYYSPAQNPPNKTDGDSDDPV